MRNPSSPSRWILASLLCLMPALGFAAFQGTVRDTQGQPAAGVAVRSYDYFPFVGLLTETGATVTAADGTYQLEVAFTQYLVAGGDGFAYVGYPSQPCYTTPCPNNSVQAVVPPATGADFVVARSGTIQGSVSRNSDGSPVTGGIVRIKSAQSPIITTGIQPDGSYAFRDLHPLNYALAAQPVDDTLLERMYPDRDLDLVDTFEQAVTVAFTAVSVAEGSESVVSLGVNPSACFEGFIDYAAGYGMPPAMDISVKRLSPSPTTDFKAIALDRAGPYRVSRMKPGSYRVSFSKLIRPNSYQPNFYPDSLTESDSTSIALPQGTCVDNLDAAILPRYSLSGTIVSSATGEVVPNAPVSIESNFVPALEGPVIYSDEDGRFLASGFPLNARAARVRPSPGWVGEAFSERPWGSVEVDEITVIDGQHREGAPPSRSRMVSVASRLARSRSSASIRSPCRCAKRAIAPSRPKWSPKCRERVAQPWPATYSSAD